MECQYPDHAVITEWTNGYKEEVGQEQISWNPVASMHMCGLCREAWSERHLAQPVRKQPARKQPVGHLRQFALRSLRRS